MFFRNLTNKKFGDLTALKPTLSRSKDGSIVWLCKCSCGNETKAISWKLVQGKKKTCSNLHQANLLIGRKMARLTILKFAYKKGKDSYVLCQCDCGSKPVILKATSIVMGCTQSCGCLNKERVSEATKTHGFTLSKNKSNRTIEVKFYEAWQAMMQRCYNPKCKFYHNYGGKGITVCKRWHKFENFRDDMLKSYLKHIEEFGKRNTTLDRIEVMGNYKPSNCRWAIYKIQSRNRRDSTKTVDYKGHRHFRFLFFHALEAIAHSRIEYSKYERYLGCSLIEFRQYIAFQFTEGMSWDNYGKGKGKWEFDHILGCNNFDLSIETQRLACCHYKNLRPMWWEDH